MLRDEDLADTPVYFHKPGEVTVIVGPFSGMAFNGAKIPLDGRHYHCAGRVFLKNGIELLADLRIQTHTFDFLEPDGAWCRIDDGWYSVSDADFLEELGLRAEDAFPFTWLPDVPLDYHEPGPYPMRRFPDAEPAV